MTKPLAIVGYIGTNTNLTFASSLVATELAAMARILERCGYEAKIAHHFWFRADLIEAGAPETITRDQVAASCGFQHSCDAFTAGWLAKA